MSKANALEEQMLRLVNGERAQAGLNPMRFNDRLNTSSEDHSSWMLDVDKFDHQGVNGSSPHERMVSAGYQFDGNWQSGENIAYMSEDNVPGLADEVAELHKGLMNSPGHRANILNPDFTEIGIGIESGQFGDAGSEFDAVMISQNFAHTDAKPAVTEVPPAQPEDNVTDEVVTEVPPAQPENDVTDAAASESTDLWAMLNDFLDGLNGADSFVFAGVGNMANIEDQGAVLQLEAIFLFPDRLGAFQQGQVPDTIDMVQSNDHEIAAHLPDTANINADWEICGGYEMLMG